MFTKDQWIFQKLVVSAVQAKLITNKVKIGPKSAWWYNRVINKFSQWLSITKKDDYLNAYWTTLGYNVQTTEPNDCLAQAPVSPEVGQYFKNKEALALTNWQVLTHELKHVQQMMQVGRPLWYFLYLWPISFAGLVLFTSWIPLVLMDGLWAWITASAWALFGAIWLHPRWPDHWRTSWELEAYTVSMYLAHTSGIDLEKLQERYISYFTSMDYYIMEPNRSKIESRLRQIKDEIVRGTHPVQHDPLVKLALSLEKSTPANV